MRTATCAVLVAAAALVATQGRGAVRGDELAGRRARLLAALDSASAALFRAGEPRTRSNDTQYPYRQESNLLYLTALNEPGLTLVLAPGGMSVDGRTVRTALFRKVREPAGDLLADTSMAVVDASRLQEVLRSLLPRLSTLYLSAPDPSFAHDWLNERPLFSDREMRKEVERRYPGLKTRSAGALVAPLRRVKSAAEVATIERAIAATGEGLLAAMRACEPGMREYELQAALEYPMIRRGAWAPAWPSIVGSGPNSLVHHYDSNRRQMGEGEVVVMDVGAEVEGYAADIPRPIPVSGRFSAEQRAVYTAVLEAQRAVIAAVRPGLPWSELDRVARQSLEASGFGRFLNHPVSHHLGIDAHDAGAMDTLRAGMVITVEPGAYIPPTDTTLAPGYRGWGIRVEDDVLVLDGGCRVLSSGIPKGVDEIEALMDD